MPNDNPGHGGLVGTPYFLYMPLQNRKCALGHHQRLRARYRRASELLVYPIRWHS